MSQNYNESRVDFKPYYKGHTDLKKKGINIEFTPEQVNEIVKCYQDIKYFLANYVYIISLDKGKVLFKLYDFQEEMIREFGKNRFTVCNLRTPITEKPLQFALFFFIKQFLIMITSLQLWLIMPPRVEKF